MVDIALLFSAFKFYSDIRALLYPELQTFGRCIMTMHCTKRRFFATQVTILTALLIFVAICAFKTGATASGRLFRPGALVVIGICEALMYCTQVSVLIFGQVTMVNLIRLMKAEPAVDADSPYGNMIARQIKKRLPKIVYAFVAAEIIQVCFFLLYTYERLTDLILLQASRLTTAPGILLTQLCLEFVFCVCLFAAICFAQKKRKPATRD